LLDFRYRKMRQVIDNRIKNELDAEFIVQDDAILKQTKEQLDEYLAGRRTGFEIPLLLIGSDFQKAVWNALMQVRYGRTATYLDLARAVENEKAVRAVAGANGANAIAIIIPCHRILGSNGELVGYGGGLAVKKKLLDLELGYRNLFEDSL
ncbi:methylated-DNA--[protein]-cysteine S-methyltransferase, partial [bacterium]|nr:methylated-DNA--[protein]-cysteine S-methyltransferase [bacterium]